MSSVNRTGITLSGGGVRAMAFHAGVFEYLASTEQMETIGYISSVSGGSLFTGLVFHFNEMKWPTSAEYTNNVLPQIRNILTSYSLQSAALQKFLNPLNWQYVFNRAELVSKTIEGLWGVNWKLKNLPKTPIWAINGTTGETGRRFRIKGSVFGDYEIGYTDIPESKLSEAMAMSAAFPGGIGPIRFNTQNLTWRKKESWESSENIENYVPEFKSIDLYDGGLYDNLGLEPLFDIGKQTIKDQDAISIRHIIVSDASTPLKRAPLAFFFSPQRVIRWINISLDQVRALRVRSFVNFVKSNPENGKYLQLGADPVKSILQRGIPVSAEVKTLLSKEWLSADDVKKAALYPTTLHKMNTGRL